MFHFHEVVSLRIWRTASSVVWNIKSSPSTEKTNWQSQGINVHHWQEHEHASLLAISQLRHQSETASSLATHAADAVVAHQCYESDRDVIYITVRSKINNQIAYLQRVFIPVSR